MQRHRRGTRQGEGSPGISSSCLGHIIACGDSRHDGEPVGWDGPSSSSSQDGHPGLKAATTAPLAGVSPAGGNSQTPVRREDPAQPINAWNLLCRSPLPPWLWSRCWQHSQPHQR